ncbi:ABC transporter permease [uncultured Desulfobacter sp.]|uniref:ABC transporter permease n=1 Tax=uncultured Desulfobacter sp. TaxID=240139 RepID=UPI002AAAFA65|nr:ABC transporter permease [uncultured Desulfobacter sp.]
MKTGSESVILKTIFIEALRSLWYAKQRTVLAIVGIIIGIGSVITIVSMGTIVQQEVLNQFKEMGTDILTFTKGNESKAGMGTKIGFRLADSLNLPEHCSDVKITAPYTQLNGTLKFEGKRMEIPALGITESFKPINKLTLTAGRFISDLDVFMYYCVIGEDVEKKLQKLGVTDVVGTKVTFRDQIFSIIGVVAGVSENKIRPVEINRGILIPVTTAMRMSNNHEIEKVIAKLTPQGDGKAAVSQIQHYYKTVANGLGVQIQTAEELIRQMQTQMRMFTLLLGIIGCISLIVGGVGVMNVMLVSVSERKKEIGIRRALGARQQDIWNQFLAESIILCFAGGIIGITVGIGASYIVARFFDWGFLISNTAVVLGATVSFAAGVFFGFYPARQAARLNPADALRAE